MSAPVDVLVMDFEEFAARRGISRADIGDAGTHKRGRNQSDNQWRRLLRTVEQRSTEVAASLSELRTEYDEAVARGEIRPLNRLERLQRAAAGHPDSASTAAAKRLLAKQEAAEATHV
jgi:hypothetical protein